MHILHNQYQCIGGRGPKTDKNWFCVLFGFINWGGDLAATK